MKKTTSGFTIVELLIVVVVIAILAAISVVAYNGIQQRANKSAVANYAANALKVLQAYKAAEGVYPSYNGCIGTGYIDRTSNGTLDCRWTTTGDTYLVNASLNAQLDKYSNIKSVIAPTQTVDAGGQSANGGHYTASNGAILDGIAHQNWFVYATPDYKCPVGPIARMTGWPNLVTDNSAAYSEGWGNGSLCWIPLK